MRNRMRLRERGTGFGTRERVGAVLRPMLFLAAGLLLPGAGLRSTSAWAAGTVLLMATLWITEPVPLWATALLPLVTFPLLSSVPLFDVARQYLDPVNFLFLGGMWIAASMEQWGLHDSQSRIGQSGDCAPPAAECWCQSERHRGLCQIVYEAVNQQREIVHPFPQRGQGHL